MTCPSDNQLAELVDGSVLDAARAEIERHLDGCDACTLLVAELAWVVRKGPTAPPGYRFVREVAPEVYEAIDRDGRSVLVELGGIDPQLAHAKHPSVAEIYDLDSGFVVYERLTTTLRTWSEGKSTAQRLAAWTQVLRGLTAIHRVGAVHGRVSPDHVFVDGERVVIGGFARPLARTAGYLAAEVLEGKRETPRSDQLAACVSLYEALAGKKPFTGATAGALAVAMATPPPPPPGVERQVAAAILRGMAFDPARRWPATSELATALADPAPGRRRWLLAAIALGVLAVIATLVL